MFGEKKNFAQNVAGLFVKPPDPKELVRKWQSDIRSTMLTALTMLPNQAVK